MNQVNKQVPIKADRQADGSLSVHSIFLTIQGEGPHVGRPAIFIRLAGCNIQCPGCDTDYTHNVIRFTFHDLVEHIPTFHLHKAKPLIVITGGEPLRQNLIPLLNWLSKHGYQVQIETNGTLGIDKEGLSDSARYNLHIVCSPKTPKVVQSLHEFIIAYKYVLDADDVDKEDGLPEHVLGLDCRPARPHDGYHKKVYVQPADEYDSVKNRRNLTAAIDSCQTFGHTLCLQTHKLIGLP